MKPVYVLWVDSTIHDGGGWIANGELPEDETLCATLGWLVKENEHSYYVAGHKHPDEVGCVMQIPKVAVKEIKAGQITTAGWEDSERSDP